jgi:glycerol-3-phosphate dehydrogenase
MGEKLHPKYNFTKAEVYWAVRNEMARTIDDVLARRVRLLYWDAKAAIECAEVVADILSMELQTDESWKSNQLDSFQKLAQQYIL